MCKKILLFLLNCKYLAFAKNMPNKNYYSILLFIIIIFIIGLNIITFVEIPKSLKIIIILMIAISFVIGNFILGIKSISQNMGNLENKLWSINDCIKLFLPIIIILGIAYGL